MVRAGGRPAEGYTDYLPWGAQRGQAMEIPS
jgi:hypothetical protein